MKLTRIGLAAVAFVAVLGCSSEPVADDTAIIAGIADDIEEGVRTGDLLKIEKHISTQARREGFEANRFLMESGYGPSASTEFGSRQITVMGDSAHLTFVLTPAGMDFSGSPQTSVVRLVKTGTWKIVSFHLIKNERQIEMDSLM